MPSKLPNPDVFASSLKPNQRNYVECKIAEQIDINLAPLVRENIKLTRTNKQLTDKIDSLELQIKAFERNFTDDMRYKLTRANIIALMKELGLK